MSVHDIIELDDSSWEKKVERNEKPVLIMFYSPTCPHCKTMEPYFNQYAEEFKDKIVFGKINILNSPTISSRYGVMGTPTFKFFCHGHPVQELVGAVYPTLIKKTIEEGLQNGENCISKTTWTPPTIDGYA